jgi:hypothetical protein
MSSKRARCLHPRISHEHQPACLSPRVTLYVRLHGSCADFAQTLRSFSSTSSASVAPLTMSYLGANSEPDPQTWGSSSRKSHAHVVSKIRRSPEANCNILTPDSHPLSSVRNCHPHLRTRHASERAHRDRLAQDHATEADSCSAHRQIPFRGIQWFISALK